MAVKLLILFLVLICNIAADRGTKFLAREKLEGKGTVRVVGNVAVLRYAENRGAFLSIGAGLPERVRLTLLILIPALIIIGGTLYLVIGISQLQYRHIIALGTLLGGGMSNLYDRIVNKGIVVDFMNLGIGGVRTGIFNVADLSILAGGIWFFISILKRDRRHAA